MEGSKINPKSIITLINTIQSTLLGLVISMMITHFYMWVRLGIFLPWMANIELTAIITVISLCRGYLFGRRLNRKVKEYYRGKNAKESKDTEK